MKPTNNSMPLNQNDMSALKEAVLCLKQQFPVIEIRLFGSKARGDATSESDIDLLVLTSKRIDWRTRNAMTDSLYDIQLKYGVVISLLVVAAKEWMSGPISVLPIHDIIEEEGIAA